MPSLVSPSSIVTAEKSQISEADRESLIRAMRQLEHRNLATRLTARFGRRMVFFGQFVPAEVMARVNRATEIALTSALGFALRSVKKRNSQGDLRRLHKTAVVVAGAAGGAFGFSSLFVELPFSTTVMLRSIAEIARKEGEDLKDPRTALACLEVFALGIDKSDKDQRPEVFESGYFAIRGILAKSVSEAASFLIGRGATEETAPILVRLIMQISQRFGIAVSQKLAAQSIPIIGAIGGAVINYAFVDHFQSIASGHFTIRRLERAYGPQSVRAEYEQLLKSMNFTGNNG
jgi:hypothetical protein